MKVLPRRRRAALSYAVVGVVLVAGAGGAYAAVDDGSSTAKTPTKTATVAQGTVQSTVDGSGSLVSPSDAGVNFVTGGTLTEVAVAPGDKVTQGEVLAKVDPTTADEALSAAQTALTSAQANLASVEAGNNSTPATGSGATGSGGGSGARSGGGQGGGTAGSGGATGRPGGTPSSGRSGSPRPRPPRPSGSPSTGPSTRPTAPASSSPSASASPSASQSASQAVSQSASQSVSQSGAAGGVVQAAAMSDVLAVTAASATPTVNPVQLADAEEQVTSAQNAVTAAKAQVAGTVITAPLSGTVASVGGKVGQTVSGGGSSSSSGSGSASSSPSGFVVITNPTGMEVSADFSEADALKLQAGQSATVTLNASGATLQAKVLSISSIPVSSSSSGSGSGGGGGGSSTAVRYAATMVVTGDTSNLQTGLSASVQVVTSSAQDALYVPTTAVTGAGGTSGSTVTLVRADGSTTREPVTLGVEGDTAVQITSGVSLGQKVELTVVSAGGSNGFPSDAFPGGAGN